MSGALLVRTGGGPVVPPHFASMTEASKPDNGGGPAGLSWRHRRCSPRLGSVVHGGHRPSSQHPMALSAPAIPLLVFVNADPDSLSPRSSNAEPDADPDRLPRSRTEAELSPPSRRAGHTSALRRTGLRGGPLSHLRQVSLRRARLSRITWKGRLGPRQQFVRHSDAAGGRACRAWQGRPRRRLDARRARKAGVLVNAGRCGGLSAVGLGCCWTGADLSQAFRQVTTLGVGAR